MSKLTNSLTESIRPIDVSLPAYLNFLAPAKCDDMVRIGRANDGGYVIPRFVLAETDCLISMGIRDDWSFESDFISLNKNVTVHAYDHTVSEDIFRRDVIASAVKSLVGMSTIHTVLERAKKLKSYRAFFRRHAVHYKERVHNRIDNEYDADFQKILSRINSGNVFIKMDIEGSEYRVIDDILSNSENIIGMVIEFHDTDPLRQVFVESVKKLTSVFEIVHMHANNFSKPARDGLPEVVELTFIKRDRCLSSKRISDLPVPGLDHPNDPFQQDYRIHFQS